MGKAADTAIGRWKNRHDLTYSQAARILGIKVHYLRKLGCGQLKRVGPKLAIQIEYCSYGEITKEELVFGDEA